MFGGVRGAYSRFFAADGLFVSAGLAFFFLVTMIPLVLLSVAMVGFVLTSEQAGNEIVSQLVAVLRASPAEFDYVVLHPIPNPPTPDEGERGYTARVAREILPRVRDALAAR